MMGEEVLGQSIFNVDSLFHGFSVLSHYMSTPELVGYHFTLLA